MAKTAFSLAMTGPFFKTKPSLTFRANARVMLAAIAKEAADEIQAELRAGEGTRTVIRVGGGRVSAEVESYTKGVRSGRPWALTSRVHVKNVGLTKARGISLHAAASEIERRDHVFRRVTNRMRRAKAINRAELLKGLQ